MTRDILKIINSSKDKHVFVAKIMFFFTLPKKLFQKIKTFLQMLWSLYSRMCTEHGFARIIIIYVFNKEWQCFQNCQYLLKTADILFVTMETGEGV